MDCHEPRGLAFFGDVGKTIYLYLAKILFMYKSAISSMHDILVVCTKNRSNQVRDRLNELRQFAHLPREILVVDSSDNSATEYVVKSATSNFPTELHYLHSEPGLPFQRNLGVNWIFNNTINPEIIHFLDDDIVPNQDYFFVMRSLFSSCPSAIAIGGFDNNLKMGVHNGFIRRIIGLGSKDQGVILKSGIAIPPLPKMELHKCQWLVGGMQSFRADLFKQQLFDPKLRMYGEDIDFYLKIATLGDVFCSSKLPVGHLNDPTNRDSIKDVNLYHNGIRWLFAHRYPNRVIRSRVLLTALALAIGEFGRFLYRRNKDHLWASVGNCEFLFRLATKRKVVQTT
jgi:GT2 family glycosyltransferase